MAPNRTRGSTSWYPAGNNAGAELLEWLGTRDWVLLEGDERDPDALPPVFLNLGTSDDGRTVCRALIVGRLAPFSAGPSEVTSRDLREIPVAQMVEQALASREIPDGYGAAVQALLERAEVVPLPKRRPGPSGITREQLELVAAYYRAAAERAPHRPWQWLVEQLDRSDSTVRRWVRKARTEGFLGEEIPGKFGEKPRTENDR